MALMCFEIIKKKHTIYSLFILIKGILADKLPNLNLRLEKNHVINRNAYLYINPSKKTPKTAVFVTFYRNYGFQSKYKIV